MNRQQRTTHNKKNQAYIEGNTVRRLDALPQEKRKEREQQQRRNRHQTSTAARRNREKAMQMDFAYVAFLSVVTIAAVLICTTYIRAQSEMTNRLNRISVLESTLLDLKTDNDAALKRMNTSIDYEAIKSKAINELGMTYPTEEQIKYYEADSTDYLDQFEDIPNN